MTRPILEDCPCNICPIEEKCFTECNDFEDWLKVSGRRYKNRKNFKLRKEKHKGEFYNG